MISRKGPISRRSERTEKYLYSESTQRLLDVNVRRQIEWSEYVLHCLLSRFGGLCSEKPEDNFATSIVLSQCTSLSIAQIHIDKQIIKI